MSPGPVLSFSGRRRKRAAGERLSQLFEEHGRMVYGICRLILRDPVEAEDAAQQTFLSAYRGLLAGQEPREPSAWLGTISRNECRGRLRGRTTEPLALASEPSGDETQREVSRRAEIEALSSALAELPPHQRDAIVLREFYGLSYAEVASALGISGAAAESLIFRSRRRLQAELKPLRAALGVLVLPPTLRESLDQALPGFGGAGATTGVGVAALAKLGTTSVAAKLAAGTLALGTLGTVAGLETHVHQRAAQRPAPAARPAAAAAAPAGPPQLSPPAVHPVAVAAHSTETQRHRGSGDRGSADHATETEPTENEHHGQATPPGTTTEGDGKGDGGSSSGGSGDGGDGGTTTTTTGSGGDHHGGDGGGGDGGTGTGPGD